jgi:hypothetical protein
VSGVRTGRRYFLQTRFFFWLFFEPFLAEILAGHGDLLHTSSLSDKFLFGNNSEYIYVSEYIEAPFAGLLLRPDIREKS